MLLEIIIKRLNFKNIEKQNEVVKLTRISSNILMVSFILTFYTPYFGILS